MSQTVPLLKEASSFPWLAPVWTLTPIPLFLLTQRILAQAGTEPSLVGIVFNPPFVVLGHWFVMVGVLLLIAIWRRSQGFVQAVFVLFLLIAFCDILWQMGTLPGPKLDPRIVWPASLIRCVHRSGTRLDRA